MPEHTWKDSLNERQLEAATHRPTPLLVLAGPGSGKTRILINRIAWLIRENGARPESILAVTFTNRAAEELRERLRGILGDEDAGRVWAYTFHAAAVRILRRFGAEIDLDPSFAIVDEDERRHAVNQLLRQANLSRERYPASEVIEFISQRKAELADPAQAINQTDPTIIELARSYEQWLKQRRALDFDDLIRHAVLLLRNHEAVRQYYHRTLRHVLVDEYQDINHAQYEFLKLLSPLNSSITIVADDDQSIYGWRGSRPELIDTFIQRYSPHIVKLDTSYRCPPNILYGAQRLITHQRSAERQRFMRSNIVDDAPIFHYIFNDSQQEQRWLVSLIKKLIEERGHRPGDIAILYRTHRLADPIQQTLMQAGYQVHRLQKESYFDQPVVRDIVRYLQLMRALSEESLVAALNFPVRLVDELTMIQLRRLADAEQVGLIDIVRRADDYPELSPLTRHHLRRFIARLEQRLPAPGADAEPTINALFDELSASRSPWSANDRSLLEGFMAFTDLASEADQLADAIDAGRPVILLHPPTLDGYAAAQIVANVLDDYLAITATSMPAQDANPAHWPEQAVVLVLGALPSTLSAANNIIHIGGQRLAGQPYSLSVYAWRLAQLLLIGYETLADGRFVVYDIETTGTDVKRDEIVELAAAAYEDQRLAGEPFQSFVRPTRGYIPRAATVVHGIRSEDVADAPDISQVLPDLLDYFGDDTVVGHNIARFDNRFIDSACGKYLNGRGFHAPFIDTMRLARRLFDLPHYSLDYLARSLGLSGDVQHRAAADVEKTAAVFFGLTERLIFEKESEALSEVLPLVALGMLSASVDRVEENAAILRAARRLLGSERAQTLLDRLSESLPAALQKAFFESVVQLEQIISPSTDDDLVWEEMRTEFLSHVAAFKRYSADTSLGAFLDYQALLTSFDTAAHTGTDEQITMMTLHNAKGAEFPVVIIIGVEQENLPLWRTLNHPEALAEERRVLYVGITRAQKSVYLFSVRNRNDGFLRSPSQFAFEIPAEHVRRYQIDAQNRIKQL